MDILLSDDAKEVLLKLYNNEKIDIIKYCDSLKRLKSEDYIDYNCYKRDNFNSLKIIDKGKAFVENKILNNSHNTENASNIININGNNNFLNNHSNISNSFNNNEFNNFVKEVMESNTSEEIKLLIQEFNDNYLEPFKDTVEKIKNSQGKKSKFNILKIFISSIGKNLSDSIIEELLKIITLFQ